MKKYEAPDAEILLITAADVITASGGDVETPEVPLSNPGMDIPG